MFVEEGYLFRGMSPRFMNEVSKCLVEERHDAGTLLYKQGEAADHLYLLIEGRVRVILDDQGQMVLAVSNPGDAIGWSSLVESEVHTATAECLAPCRVNKISRERLAEIFDRDPKSGLQFYRRLAKLFRQQLIDTYRLLPAAHGEKRAAPGF
jgi:CRP-like cAMP-binding protein